MGEKIKDIKKISLGDCELIVELNEATSPGGNRWIHVQNDNFRIQFSEGDFVMILAGILKAKERLRYNKGKSYDSK